MRAVRRIGLSIVVIIGAVAVSLVAIALGVPSDAAQWVWPWAFVACLLAFIVGVMLIIIATLRNEHTLRRSGIRLVATVVNLNEGFTYNSFDECWEWQYWVTALWTDPATQQPRTFQSDHRSARPACRMNDPVIVFLDPHKANNYLVDC
jgi:hypothetical protein